MLDTYTMLPNRLQRTRTDNSNLTYLCPAFATLTTYVRPCAFVLAK